MIGPQFIRHDFVVVPITPIHIGGGEEAVLGLEDYRLKNNSLERCDLKGALLAAPNLNALLRDMAKDPIATIRRVQNSVDDREITERICVSNKVLEAINPIKSKEVSRNRRRGDIYAFQRSGEYPVLPGSSIKGCLRTAWLAECVRRKEIRASDLPHEKSRHGRLFEIAFEIDHQDTATDPFREISVSDALIPADSTRVDLVSTRKFNNREEGNAQKLGIINIRERIKAVCDGGKPPLISVQIGLRHSHIQEQRPDNMQIVTAPKSVHELLSALEAHHAPLWTRDIERFFPKSAKGLQQSLAIFDDLNRSGKAPCAALCRMGWASHAEAKSVAGFRKIHRPQFKGRSGEFAEEGSARHVVDLPGGPFPFGWALLVTAEAWQARKTSNWLPVAASTTIETEGHSSRLELSRNVGSVLYRKGDRLRLEDGSICVLEENMSRDQKEAQAEIDGDIETIKQSEIIGKC